MDLDMFTQEGFNIKRFHVPDLVSGSYIIWIIVFLSITRKESFLIAWNFSFINITKTFSFQLGFLGGLLFGFTLQVHAPFLSSIQGELIILEVFYED